MCSTDGQEPVRGEQLPSASPLNTKSTVAEGLVTLDSVAVIDYDAVWAAENKTTFTEQVRGQYRRRACGVSLSTNI